MKSSGNNWNTSAEMWGKLKPHARRMRKKPTNAENLLWNEIKNKKLNGIKFRRQHALGYFIVDFYTVIRFRNEEIQNSMKSVLERILDGCKIVKN